MENSKATATQLVDKVQKNDKKARGLNRIVVGFIVIIIIATLGFIAFSSAKSNQNLRKLIDDNHNYSTAQNNQELALSRSNEQLLEQQNVYLTCLVTLFTHQTRVTAVELATCRDPFIMSTPNNPSGAVLSPKVSTQSKSNTSTQGSSQTNTAQTQNSPPTSNPATPPASQQSIVQKLVTNPVKSILNTLGL